MSPRPAPEDAGAATPANPRAGDARRRLAATARELYRRGWMSGTAGNLSSRQADGSYWITASGKPKGELTARDFLRLRPGGEVLARGRAGDRPSAEWCLHDAVYRLFPAAGACYHVHTVAANVVSRLAAAELPLPPIEMLKGLGVAGERPQAAISVFTNHAHVPAIAAEVEARFRAAPPRLPGFLIRDHGLTVWGSDSRAALGHLELFDFIFQCMLAARGAGEPPFAAPRYDDQVMTRQRPSSTQKTAPAAIGPDDPRYADLAHRGFNKRFRGKPDVVRLVCSTGQVVDAVEDAVRKGLRIGVRSGGHCLEGFVADPKVKVLIDTSLMAGVHYDERMSAFAVEAGATLGEVYRRLFLGWGALIPAGESPDIGMGGHVSGGAFGFLCREHGLAADYLYGVEVVVVDASGTARSVVATREPSDPNRDLWWAHTGGGGGNFGIVTRCWFRAPGATGTDPAALLPKAPGSVLTFRVAWNWEDLDEARFTRLVRNHGEWCERNSGAASPSARIFSILFLNRRQAGRIDLRGLSTAGPQAERLFDEHLAAIDDGLGAPHTRSIENTSWLRFALNPFPELFKVPGTENASCKIKDAFLRKRFTDRQIAVAYRYLTRTDHDVPGGMLGLATYGGQINTVAPDATASAQRDSILTTACSVGWLDPKDEERNLAWVRALYSELYADTGGVPAPGERTDGTLINHPDADLADPQWNTSGVPWYTLYYKDNYPRLQKIKARWDPRNVFSHALSIRA